MLVAAARELRPDRRLEPKTASQLHRTREGRVQVEQSGHRGVDPLSRGPPAKVPHMSVSTILLVILIVLLIGAIPTWPYNAGWGYYPSGGIGILLLIVIILVVSGR